MFSNKCVKCGVEFETKNPKRVICPNCLYPETAGAAQAPRPGQAGPRPGGGFNRGPGGPRPGGGPGGPRPGGFGPRPGGGGFNRGPGGPRPGGGFNRGPGGPRPGGRPGGGFNRGPGGPRRGGPPKKLLVSKEQLIEIEKLYMQALPLPNPDVHETIGMKIDLAPSKVFFGINLIREKMRLPKLEYPKRKLAVTPEQLVAIETSYDMYMPLPPLGVHKIISKQLKIDEWRVHVAIGLIRKNRNMDRWNESRDDIPEQMKVPKGKKPHPEKTPEQKAAEQRAADLRAAEAAEAEAARQPRPAAPPSQQQAAPAATGETAAVAKPEQAAAAPVAEAAPVKVTAPAEAISEAAPTEATAEG